MLFQQWPKEQGLYNSLPHNTAACPVFPATALTMVLQNTPQTAVPGSCDESPPMPLKPVVWFWVERGGNAFAGDWGVLNAEPKFGGKPCMLWVWGAAEPPKLRDAMPASESIWMKKGKIIHRQTQTATKLTLCRFCMKTAYILKYPEKSFMHDHFKFWSHPDYPKKAVCL